MNALGRIAFASMYRRSTLRWVRRSSVIIVAISALACGTDPDTRPETADYIIEAILVPSCGRAACHSSETRAHNLEFDTIDSALAAMKSQTRGQVIVKPGDPQGSELVTVLTGARNIMPPDSPLPQADIDLITRWITDGAEGLE